MLEHWIQPIDSTLAHEGYLAGDRLGSNLSGMAAIQQAPQRRAVALIGVDSRWARYVRRHLYKFTFRMPDMAIYDLGNLRRSDPDFVTGPLMELMTPGICPVLIGAHPGLIKSLRQSMQFHKQQLRPAFVHETVPEVALQSEDRSLVIGVQQHLVPRQCPKHLETLHLSRAQQHMYDADTLVRESNALVFDLSAMSAIDVPAQRSVSVSGFNTTDACTIMRSAGLHADTRAVYLSGHDPMSLQLDQSANVAAQMIWYFLEAYHQCIPEVPTASKTCTAYTVHLDDYDTDFTFYKSERTGRWWVGFSRENGQAIFPCTYYDYQHAMNGEVTDRILHCATESLESIEH